MKVKDVIAYSDLDKMTTDSVKIKLDDGTEITIEEYAKQKAIEFHYHMEYCDVHHQEDLKKYIMDNLAERYDEHKNPVNKDVDGISREFINQLKMFGDES